MAEQVVAQDYVLAEAGIVDGDGTDGLDAVVAVALAA